MRIVTIEECNAQIIAKTAALESDPDDRRKIAELLIWQSFKRIIEEGKTLTLDENDRVKLWEHPQSS